MKRTLPIDAQGAGQPPAKKLRQASSTTGYAPSTIAITYTSSILIHHLLNQARNLKEEVSSIEPKDIDQSLTPEEVKQQTRCIEGEYFYTYMKTFSTFFIEDMLMKMSANPSLDLKFGDQLIAVATNNDIPLDSEKVEKFRKVIAERQRIAMGISTASDTGRRSPSSNSFFGSPPPIVTGNTTSYSASDLPDLPEDDGMDSCSPRASSA